MMKVDRTTSGFEELSTKNGADKDEMMAIDDDSKISEERRDDSVRQEEPEGREERDDSGNNERDDDIDANERVDAPTQKTSAKPAASKGKHKKQGSGSSLQGRRYQPEGFQGHYGAGRGAPFQPLPGQGGPRGHANAPAAPFPRPPYGYAGGPPHDPYLGAPPPPHFLTRPGQPPYAPPPVSFHPGHQGPPPHSNMPGHPAGPGFNMPPFHHGAPFPPVPYPVGMPAFSASDSASIGSTKSKGSARNRKSKGPRKKRTIDDGVHGGMSAFSFPRTSSNASSTSSTVGNNTSTETPCLTDDSPQKQNRGSELPPLSHPSSANLFEDADHLNSAMNTNHHRREGSLASTASSLSIGGLSMSASMSSYEPKGGNDDAPLMRASPKRRKGQDSRPSSFDVTAAPAVRLKSLSMEDSSHQRASSNGNLFLSLSTSPINADMEATPSIKNTKKSVWRTSTVEGGISSRGAHSFDQDTPTPPIPENAMVERDMMTDEHLLNQHLRSQSFTPLSHLANGSEGRESASESPPTLSNNPSFSSGIAPQLSWSIAGDAPSLADLAEWDDVKSQHHYRNPSQVSNGPRGMVLSPQDFAMWNEEVDNAIARSHSKSGGEGDGLRLSALSPNSTHEEGGATTPLPIFFDRPASAEERENFMKASSTSEKDKSKTPMPPTSGMRPIQPEFGDSEHIHQLFVSNVGRAGAENNRPFRPFPATNTGDHLGLPHMRAPPPVYDNFGRSPLNREGPPPPNFFPSNMFGGQPPNNGMLDRVRNLRGRVPPGLHPPMPLHVPPPGVSSLHLASPMGVASNGKLGMWGMHPSPHHMAPPDRNASKRKCIPLKPPIPSKFQGDMDKHKSAQVPEFTSLVNFPAHMSQKQSVNLPEKMRCCVMCGQACPCSTGSKNKKNKDNNNNSSSGATTTTAKSTGGKSDGGLANRKNNNGQDNADKQEGIAIIPTQNKGLCTLCDVNVWVVTQSGLEIKWCKGCKNFRPWASFGDKGLATKCLRCRERQREKYALQKEEKEKARIIKKAIVEEANNKE